MKEYVALWQIGDVTRGEIIQLDEKTAERFLKLGAVKETAQKAEPAARPKAPAKEEPEIPEDAETEEEADEEDVTEETEPEAPEIDVTAGIVPEEAPAKTTTKRGAKKK